MRSVINDNYAVAQIPGDSNATENTMFTDDEFTRGMAYGNRYGDNNLGTLAAMRYRRLPVAKFCAMGAWHD